MAATGIRAGQIQNFYGMLEAVSVISTSNLTLSGLQNINGATGVAGDRVLVTQQTTPTEDGIYLQRAGAWERAPDADNAGSFIADLAQMVVIVEDGTDAGKMYRITNLRGAGVVGTNALTTTLYFAPAAAITYVYGEEAIYTDLAFTATIANAPSPATTLRVYRNGNRLQLGGGNDYTLAGTTITFVRRLRNPDKILVDYQY